LQMKALVGAVAKLLGLTQSNGLERIPSIMRLAVFALAALLELSGCYLMWLGQKQSSLLLWLGGAFVLAGFGVVLAQVGDALPSRSYAVYGGIYIGAALVWMVAVDRHVPDRWDIAGVLLSLTGAMVILFGPRG
jgi:small multidrug resistance family-3 protein